MKEWIEENHKQLSVILKATQALGTCLRLKVGAIVLMKKDNGFYIVGSGSNTSLPNEPTCEDENECLKNEQGRCVRTVHAEHNAILDALKRTGGNIKGATLLCTHEPCENCVKLIESFGIEQVYFLEEYENPIAKRLRSRAIYNKIEL